MIWECNSKLACECTGLSSLAAEEDLHNEKISHINPTETSDDPEIPNTLKSAFARTCHGKASQQEVLDLWLRIIELYSTLSLTNLFDRTYALAGLSSRVSGQMDSAFLAGIWAADLPRSLLWSSWPRQVKRRKRLTPTFPTWSWMSQYDPDKSNSHVLFPENSEEFIQDSRLQVHYSDSFCEWSDGNPFGGIVAGQLEVTAPVLPGNLALDEEAREEGTLAVCVGNLALGEAWFDCPTVDCVEGNQNILCLYPGTLGKNSVSGMDEEAYVLLLRPVQGSESYSRIGILFLNLEELHRFDHAEVRRVKII